MGGGCLVDFIRHRGIRVRDFFQIIVSLADRISDHQIKKLFLTSNIVVQAALEHAHCSCDIFERRRPIALFFKQTCRCGNNFLFFRGGCFTGFHHDSNAPFRYLPWP